jgi:DNA repair protein RadC
MSSGMPREKMIEHGAASLSDSELLAIILRSGGRKLPVIQLASNILDEFGGFKGLIDIDSNQLKTFPNVGEAKATAVKACIEIALRIKFYQNEKKPVIKSPQDVFDYVRKDLFGKQQEHLLLLTLDTSGKVISKDLVSVGTINETLIHPREIFKKALSLNSAGIILIHNHPSGNSQPSEEDLKVTERIMRVGVDMGIPLLDHLIVTDKDYSSIKIINLKGGDKNKSIKKSSHNLSFFRNTHGLESGSDLRGIQR